MPLKVRSVVGLLPLAATTRLIRRRPCDRLPELAARLRWFLHQPGRVRRRDRRPPAVRATAGSSGCCPWSGQDQLLRILARMLDAEEFLSPYGLRTLSRAHLDEAVHGARWAARTSPSATSRPSRTSGLFGGNSNWRGPIWMPVNYLLIEALREFAAFFGDDLHGGVPDRLAAARRR